MTKEHLFSVTKKDLTVQTFRSGGPGGQHQNKRNTGVRIIHKESGAVGESREERSQHKNKRIAFKRLSQNSKFKLWLNQKVKEIIDNKTIEQKVNEQIRPENLLIEVNIDGKWVKE